MEYHKKFTTALLCVAVVCLGAAADANAQWSSSRDRDVSSLETQPPRRMIDSPTAGTLRKGSFDTELRAYPDGGMLAILQIGLTDRWQIGISYGGTDVISSNDPSWNPRMQFLTKLQIISETYSFPGVAIGFEDQGFGHWIDSLDRYQIKSKGFYVAGSKGYRGSGFTSSIHGGLNYSREDSDDNDIDFYFGADMVFDNNVGIVSEFDMALNDDRTPRSLGKGRGYLNAGVRWMLLDRIFLEGVVKDILRNRRDTDTIGRELRLLYFESF
jgi:hypothetical protein